MSETHGAKRRKRVNRSSMRWIRENPLAVGIAVFALMVLGLAAARLIAAYQPDLVVRDGEEAVSSADPSEGGASYSHEAPPTIFVHVSGCVANPGLYELSESSRVADAIEAAGGLLPEAQPDAVNLARALFDGEQVIVPSLQQEGGGVQSFESGAVSPGKININTATAEELDGITGVGPSTAEKIVADREENGPYLAIEDLKRVSGIGDKKFESMRDEICVG